ncbi:TetR/AcrR family transcriptional regulator [Dyadobacter pollutisoli]|jgi:TetR/AcrR family transcriptional repressor of nem operon|uniref:TetR/AcrR family transcriptional regulator n=1 Tax=Dyadobacter pollutisoli TaxID=2910158 RepID=A0A9E8SRS5_9BACT|nr:TetR/AcrR family transcriptional regulator [Dyadobacter pollutisoli]WAC14522.1 TetR/AcrR family transcriptional regulator [Dyadobacter pollutisoli]
MARPKKFDEAATLQKALRVFWKKGYSGTSMSDLVKAMEINAPSLYDTYGDKQQLFLAALQSYLRSQHDWMKDVSTKEVPVKDTIKLLLDTLVEDTLNDPEKKGCFMVNTVTELANVDEKILAVASDNEKQVQEILQTLIRKGQANGEISRDKNPEILAAYVFTNLMGVRVVAATNSNKNLLHAAMEVVVSSL